MGNQYFCKSERRRQAVREHPTLNGIDFLEVLDQEAIPLASPRQRTLLVRTLKPFPTTVSGDNVLIHGSVRIGPIGVEWAARATEAGTLFADGLINVDERDFFLGQTDPDRLLIVRTDSDGDFSTYRLCLVSDDAPLVGFDPLLAEVEFSFKVECPSDFDCAPVDVCPPEPLTVPLIDYLSKDYASFRRLMFDRLSVIMPEWRDRLPADLGVAFVELLAYAGDHLSYYQDAAGTEAYLGTARRRPSVRRHARLLDYRMHDGCNARTWVVVRADNGVTDVLLRREYVAGETTRLMTRVPDEPPPIASEDFERIRAEQGPEVFELLYDLRLYSVHNDLFFHTWGNEECCLPKGATRATLRDDETERLRLRPGDVLVVEERLGPSKAAEADADPKHRHALRLTRVDPLPEVDDDGVRTPGPLRMDEALGQPVVDIEWGVEDALAFPLCLSTVIERDGEQDLIEDVSFAHGNVVLVDHGRTLPEEKLPTPTGERSFRPRLKERDITQGVPFSPADWDEATPGENRWLSASAALSQDPRQALPTIALRSAQNEDWHPEHDLLASDRFDTDFVVETESDGRAPLRFGDNIFGQIPEAGIDLTATYRVGTGVRGNVGAESVRHIVTTPGIGIVSVRNPLPATGGVEPETLEQVRLYAPQAFRWQERAVTEADYATVAERHPEVTKAVARRRWTGSWHTVFITVDRASGREVNREFERELTRFIECFELAGHDVEIERPVFVPLDIAMTVCVEPNYLRSEVKRVLLDVFSDEDLPDGSRGFFHPDKFTFGQPVYLSEVIARAMDVPGLRWVTIDPDADPPGRFHRWGKKPATEIADGWIPIGRFEIARIENDPNAPENGRIGFNMDGGL